MNSTIINKRENNQRATAQNELFDDNSKISVAFNCLKFIYTSLVLQ